MGLEEIGFRRLARGMAPPKTRVPPLSVDDETVLPQESDQWHTASDRCWPGRPGTAVSRINDNCHRRDKPAEYKVRGEPT